MSGVFGGSLAAIGSGSVPVFTLPLAYLGHSSLAASRRHSTHAHVPSRVIAPPTQSGFHATYADQNSLFALFQPTSRGSSAAVGSGRSSVARLGSGLSVSSLLGTPPRRELHALSAASAPALATSSSSSSPSDATFDRLRARSSQALSEEVECDSDNTREEDLQLLNDGPAAAHTQQHASFAHAHSAPFPLPPRRTPSILDAMSMPPEQLVHGLTLTDREAEASYRAALADAAAAGVDVETLAGGGEETAASSSDSFLQSFVELASSPARREKAALASRPHTWHEYFIAGGLVEDTANYNTLLRICKAKGLYEEGMAHWRRMQQLGLTAEPATYTALVSLCGLRSPDASVNGTRLAHAYRLLDEYKAAHGGRVEEAFFNALVVAAGSLAGRAEAEKVLELMRRSGVQPSQITYTALLDLCRKQPTPDSLQRAEQLFSQMKSTGGALEPDTHTYNVIIRLAGETRRADLAIALFDEMRSKQYAPDHYTYANLMHACSRTPGYATHAVEYFSDYVSQGFKPSTAAYNILLHAFSREGDVAHAQQLWTLMLSGEVARDQVTYNTMINVIAESMERDYVRRRPPTKGDARPEAQLGKDELLTKEERIRMADALLAQMKQEGVTVSTHTLNACVKVVARAGRLQRALLERDRLFEEHPNAKMDFYSHKPIFDMFLKNSRVARAVDYCDTMRAAGFPPNAAMYRALLHAIERSGKLSVAERDSLGQRTLAAMRADGVSVPERFHTLFDPAAYAAQQRAAQQARRIAQTIKVGPAHSYTQREDALIRPAKNRTGSGRLGSTRSRVAQNPQLGVYRQKREERAAEHANKMRNLRPTPLVAGPDAPEWMQELANKPDANNQ